MMIKYRVNKILINKIVIITRIMRIMRMKSMMIIILYNNWIYRINIKYRSKIIRSNQFNKIVKDSLMIDRRIINKWNYKI